MSVSDPADREARARARALRPSLGALAWLGILITIAIVQLVRQQWGDAVIFAIAGLVLAAEACGWLAKLDRLPAPTRTVVGIGAAAAAAGLVIAPRHSAVAGAVMIATGIAAMAAVWAPPRTTTTQRRPWSRPLRLLAWSWAVAWIVACLWEIVEVTLGATTPGGRAAHPALSDLLDAPVDQLLGKLLFVIAWVAAGLFLVRRGPRS